MGGAINKVYKKAESAVKDVAEGYTNRFGLGGNALGSVIMGPIGAVGGTILGNRFGKKTAKGTAPEVRNGRIVSGEEIEELDELLAGERERLRGLETQARSRLSESTKGFGGAVDKRLETLLEETGFQAGEAKKAAGISFAGRGLGRSSFATEAVGEIGQAEVSQRAGLRQEASQIKSQAEEAAGVTAQSISDRRVSISNRLRDLERQGLQSAAFQEEIANVKTDFNKFITELDLDDQRQNNLISMFKEFV